MEFAPKKSLVDAMIGHPHVVTMGVWELVVKPATRFAGLFAMSFVAHLLIEKAPARPWRPPCRRSHAVILAIGLVLLGLAPGHAGSATGQFQVTARVIKGCQVSADAIASQADSAKGTIKANCQNSGAPASSSGSADGVGGALPSSTATVNYSVDEVAGGDGGLKIITVNF